MTSTNPIRNTHTQERETSKMSTNTNVNPDKQRNEGIREVLRQFAEGHPASDSIVAHHTTPRHKISIPEDMTTARAAKQLAQAATAEQEEKAFNKTFRYRPWDGAAALHRVMKKYFGTTGRGLAVHSFFGSTPPQEIEIEVAYQETISVPWGRIEFEPFEGYMDLGGMEDPEYGPLFHISVVAKKKYSAEVYGFFKMLEMELAEHSIYKGKAIRGNDEPKFLDLSVDPSVVYNEDVYASLDQSIWGVIREADLLRSLNVKTDPKVLLHGPYGTGKSEAGRMTARVAVEHGWTFISFNSGKSTLSDLEKTMQTARLLAPAVVFVEDVDIFASDEDSKAQSRMLEMFDGISSKNQEVMVLMTSNRPASFSKGMLRAGRINKMIEIGPLDRKATERLIRLVNKDMLGEVDFDAVWEATAGFEPAFIRQTFDDARQAAAIRHATELRAAGTYTEEAAKKFLLTTEDFVTAANVMRPQHHSHLEAKEQEKAPSLEQMIRNTLVSGLIEDLVLSNEKIGDIESRLIEK